MKKRWKILIAILAIIILAILFAGYKISYAPVDTLPKNDITFANQVELTEKDKAELIKSVDDFMNEHKRSKEVLGSYLIRVERRLGNAVEMNISFEEEAHTESLVVYAEKKSGVWQVDPNGGPWCTLETFVDKTCF